MNRIQVLDQMTIDKIAAGEVIERPASVVKELLENAVDAKATAVTAEIKEGGISFIRIADNGCGMERDDVRAAFLRHSTSKLRSAEELLHIGTLGFRGEALSSIAAVSQVELVTKTKDCEYGTRYCISGGREEALEETGAPDGTTFLVHQLFYNTPARKKFLKTPMTEAGHVGELMTKIALSHPEISFRFINNGQVKLHTSGNGNLKDVIYHVYGREITANLLPVDYKKNGICIAGYLGKPVISRGNRNFENYFVDGRYIKSSILSKAIEDAYKDFSMQHKYPFVVLSIGIEGGQVDVNVHPTKMDVRFGNQQEVYNVLYEAVSAALHEKELIPQVTLDSAPKTVPKTRDAAAVPERINAAAAPERKDAAVSPETRDAAALPERRAVAAVPQEKNLEYFMEKMKERVKAYHEQSRQHEDTAKQPEELRESSVYQPEQLSLFDEKLLREEARTEHKLIGQIFDTYWLVEYHDNLYIIDQHAAHERVLYERTLRGMQTRSFPSQMISPPIILDLTMQEAGLLKTHMERFTRIGFEFEEFGQDSYAVRAVPDNLFSIAKKELLLEMLDSLSEEISRNAPSNLIDEKIASMSCKAAVKGNMRLSAAEADALIKELLTLENPYHCPHGRPTIIAMSKRELEKKFKRIV